MTSKIEGISAETKKTVSDHYYVYGIDSALRVLLASGDVVLREDIKTTTEVENLIEAAEIAMKEIQEEMKLNEGNWTILDRWADAFGGLDSALAKFTTKQEAK